MRASGLTVAHGLGAEGACAGVVVVANVVGVSVVRDQVLAELRKPLKRRRSRGIFSLRARGEC